jgi:hypothetical protein
VSGIVYSSLVLFVETNLPCPIVDHGLAGPLVYKQTLIDIRGSWYLNCFWNVLDRPWGGVDRGQDSNFSFDASTDFAAIEQRLGVSRRTFLKFCTGVAASFGLGTKAAFAIAEAIASRPNVRR